MASEERGEKNGAEEEKHRRSLERSVQPEPSPFGFTAPANQIFFLKT